MSHLNRQLTRTAFAGLALALASTLVVSAVTPVDAAVPPAAGRSADPGFNGATPMCVVGAALLYPIFIGNILLADPVSLPSALTGYWTGGDNSGHGAGHDDDFHGWLPACGVTPGGAPKAG
jgi:hypothetical protein